MNADPGPGARTEALINLADKLASQPLPPPAPPRRWPVVVAGAGVVAAIVLGVAAIADRGGDGADLAGGAPAGAPGADGDATTTSVGDAPPTVVAQAAVPVPTDATTTTTTTTSTATSTAASTVAPATTGATGDTNDPAGTGNAAGTAPASAGPTGPGAPGAEQPVRWAEFTGGKVYLRGLVPDQATADEVRSKAALVVGEANVVVEYTIVPGAPRPSSAPLYVRDSVLFDPGSSIVQPASQGVLDLGVALMTQNPQVTIDIQGHTDADGPEHENMVLSRERVDAIFDYLVAAGVDPARLTREAFGETRPIADNTTAEGRARNRRVEFTINNLLG